MSDFRNWYVRNQDSITWFIIGWLGFALLQNLAVGDWFWAAVDAALIYFNYKMSSVRLR